MTPHDIDILERQTVFRGYFRIDRYRLRHATFAGGWTGEMVREVFERGHAVAVLLYDPDRDRVVLIEQFRIGAHAAGRQAWLLEVVAGIIGEGEAPEAVAHRETLEETGCVATDLIPIADYLPSPGGSSETIGLYCARTDARTAGGVHGLVHEHEDIRTVVMTTDEAIARLDAGTLDNSAIIIAIAWLARNRERLRRLWATAG
ncbi:MAG: NUDIX domain-containing protein [Rhodospirillaceae bacterium]